jgi:alkaline phosphatase D
MTSDPFLHGVASGDPLEDRVIIWTRVTTDSPRARVHWLVGRDPELRHVVAAGEAIADSEHDHTVHVDVTGLEPGTEYHFGFLSGAAHSPVGRTRTLPGGDAERLRFAMCSCAKYNAGHFNAYGRIAERDDLDFLLHLGDYIYEASQTPPASQTASPDIGRPFEPRTECRTLAEYRTRYAQYRRDPDVQAMHRRLPVIATLDDHELADGAWAGGATEHRDAEHGGWAERRDAAMRARWEWLPARRPDASDATRVFRSVRVGGLAELMLLDVRSRRDEPVAGPAMDDPRRSMLGTEQREWLHGRLDATRAAWRVVVSPSIMSPTFVADPDEPLRTALLKLKLIHPDGAEPDEDQWDGYPAERAALLERFAALDDVVVLSGDIHVSVAGEMRHDDDVVAVELTTPSLTSQNLDEKLGVAQRAAEIEAAEAALAEGLGLTWCELSSHGYVVVDLDPTRLRGEWWHVEQVLERSDAERQAAALEVPRGVAALRFPVEAR